MLFHTYGNKRASRLMLLSGLGVSHEIFLPLVELLQEDFYIVTVEVDGFVLGKHTHFTTIDDQAEQANRYIKEHLGGHLDCAYGLSMGGKILSRMVERGEITITHAVLDAAPLLPLPRWLVAPLSHYQALNVWTCYHWTGFWRRVFHSHYFDVLLDECCKVYPWGGRRAVIDGYKDIYTNRLESIVGTDIHYWHGTKESFVAKYQVEHLLRLRPDAHIEVFPKMNHGQLLTDHPEEVAKRIIDIATSVVVRPARREDAAVIARAVAMAVGDEVALRNYCGEDYLAVLTEIAAHEGTQYSWQYALVAEANGAVAGAVVGYDGARLSELREGTFALLREKVGRVPTIADETEAGEVYLDSVGVLPEFRGLGVGRKLVAAFCERAFAEGHERVGLMVDYANPNAERLYTSLGFERIDTKRFFGHQMWHLQKTK